MNENEKYITFFIIVWFLTTALLFTDALNIHPGKYILNKLRKLIKYLKKSIVSLFYGRYAIISWFGVALVLIVLIIIILPKTIGANYKYEDIVEKIYSEIYGLLFDVILFGIIISIYHILTERIKSIEDEIEQIDDFRGWKSNEASHRILGSIKRLQRLNVYKIDLSNCCFKEITLQDLFFKDSKMTGLVLFNTQIFNTTFQNIKSNIVHCRDSKIDGCSFEKGKIIFNLHTTDISSTLFYDIDISSASFFTKSLSFVLFYKVNFSYSFFKFEECSCVEFIDCNFDECIVDDYFFTKISDPMNHNLGHQKINLEYDLIHEVAVKLKFGY